MTTPAPDDNPYAVPKSLAEPQLESDMDRYIIEQSRPLMKPKEKVRFTATLAEAPSPGKIFLWAMLAVIPAVGIRLLLIDWDIPTWALGALSGGLVALVMTTSTKLHLAAISKRRIVLIRARMGAWGPKQANLGTEEILWKNVAGVDVGGIANNRSVKFRFKDLTERTFRMAPWSKVASGQKDFFEYLQNWTPPPEKSTVDDSE